MRTGTATRRGVRPLSVPLPVDMLRGLLPLLALAVTAEVLLFRVVSRVGVHIPKDGLVLSVYSRLTQLGSYSFNLATVLAGVCAVVAAVVQMTTGRSFTRHTLLPGWLLVLVAEAAVFASLPPSESGRLVFGVTAAITMALVALSAERHREVIGVSAAAFLLAAYYTLTNLAATVFEATQAAPFSSDSVRLGEALVPVAALAVFIAWGPPLKPHAIRSHPRRYLLPTLAVIGVAAAFFAPGSTSSILSLWTTGLSLYLPFPLYVLALWLYALTFAHCLATGRTQVAAALVLLFAAGLSLETTYQWLLAVLALITLGAQSEAAA